MGGGILQLVAYGIQDMIFSSTPQITFFKTVYKRYSNFTIDQKLLEFKGITDFGKKTTCELKRHGDLLGKIYLRIHLPEIVMRYKKDAIDRIITELNDCGIKVEKNDIIISTQDICSKVTEESLNFRTRNVKDLLNLFLQDIDNINIKLEIVLSNAIENLDEYVQYINTFTAIEQSELDTFNSELTSLRDTLFMIFLDSNDRNVIRTNGTTAYQGTCDNLVGTIFPTFTDLHRSITDLLNSFENDMLSEKSYNTILDCSNINIDNFDIFTRSNVMNATFITIFSEQIVILKDGLAGILNDDGNSRFEAFGQGKELFINMCKVLECVPVLDKLIYVQFSVNEMLKCIETSKKFMCNIIEEDELALQVKQDQVVAELTVLKSKLLECVPFDSEYVGVINETIDLIINDVPDTQSVEELKLLVDTGLATLVTNINNIVLIITNIENVIYEEVCLLKSQVGELDKIENELVEQFDVCEYEDIDDFCQQVNKTLMTFDGVNQKIYCYLLAVLEDLENGQDENLSTLTKLYGRILDQLFQYIFRKIVVDDLCLKDEIDSEPDEILYPKWNICLINNILKNYTTKAKSQPETHKYIKITTSYYNIIMYDTTDVINGYITTRDTRLNIIDVLTSVVPNMLVLLPDYDQNNPEHVQLFDALNDFVLSFPNPTPDNFETFFGSYLDTVIYNKYSINNCPIDETGFLLTIVDSDIDYCCGVQYDSVVPNFIQVYSEELKVVLKIDVSVVPNIISETEEYDNILHEPIKNKIEEIVILYPSPTVNDFILFIDGDMDTSLTKTVPEQVNLDDFGVPVRYLIIRYEDKIEFVDENTYAVVTSLVNLCGLMEGELFKSENYEASDSALNRFIKLLYDPKPYFSEENSLSSNMYFLDSLKKILSVSALVGKSGFLYTIVKTELTNYYDNVEDYNKLDGYLAIERVLKKDLSQIFNLKQSEYATRMLNVLNYNYHLYNNIFRTFCEKDLVTNKMYELDKNICMFTPFVQSAQEFQAVGGYIGNIDYIKIINEGYNEKDSIMFYDMWGDYMGVLNDIGENLASTFSSKIKELEDINILYNYVQFVFKQVVTRISNFYSLIVDEYVIGFNNSKQELGKVGNIYNGRWDELNIALNDPFNPNKFYYVNRLYFHFNDFVKGQMIDFLDRIFSNYTDYIVTDINDVKLEDGYFVPPNNLTTEMLFCLPVSFSNYGCYELVALNQPDSNIGDFNGSLPYIQIVINRLKEYINNIYLELAFIIGEGINPTPDISMLNPDRAHFLYKYILLRQDEINIPNLPPNVNPSKLDGRLTVKNIIFYYIKKIDGLVQSDIGLPFQPGPVEGFIYRSEYDIEITAVFDRLKKCLQYDARKHCEFVRAETERIHIEKCSYVNTITPEQIIEFVINRTPPETNNQNISDKNIGDPLEFLEPTAPEHDYSYLLYHKPYSVIRDEYLTICKIPFLLETEIMYEKQFEWMYSMLLDEYVADTYVGSTIYRSLIHVKSDIFKTEFDENDQSRRNTIGEFDCIRVYDNLCYNPLDPFSEKNRYLPSYLPKYRKGDLQIAIDKTARLLERYVKASTIYETENRWIGCLKDSLITNADRLFSRREIIKNIFNDLMTTKYLSDFIDTPFNELTLEEQRIYTDVTEYIEAEPEQVFYINPTECLEMHKIVIYILSLELNRYTTVEDYFGYKSIIFEQKVDGLFCSFYRNNFRVNETDIPEQYDVKKISDDTSYYYCTPLLPPNNTSLFTKSVVEEDKIKGLFPILCENDKDKIPSNFKICDKNYETIADKTYLETKCGRILRYDKEVDKYFFIDDETITVEQKDIQDTDEFCNLLYTNTIDGRVIKQVGLDWVYNDDGSVVQDQNVIDNRQPVSILIERQVYINEIDSRFKYFDVSEKSTIQYVNINGEYVQDENRNLGIPSTFIMYPSYITDLVRIVGDKILYQFTIRSRKDNEEDEIFSWDTGRIELLFKDPVDDRIVYMDFFGCWFYDDNNQDYPGDINKLLPLRPEINPFEPVTENMNNAKELILCKSVETGIITYVYITDTRYVPDYFPCNVLDLTTIPDTTVFPIPTIYDVDQNIFPCREAYLYRPIINRTNVLPDVFAPYDDNYTDVGKKTYFETERGIDEFCNFLYSNDVNDRLLIFLEIPVPSPGGFTNWIYRDNGIPVNPNLESQVILTATPVPTLMERFIYTTDRCKFKYYVSPMVGEQIIVYEDDGKYYIDDSNPPIEYTGPFDGLRLILLNDVERFSVSDNSTLYTFTIRITVVDPMIPISEGNNAFENIYLIFNETVTGRNVRLDEFGNYTYEDDSSPFISDINMLVPVPATNPSFTTDSLESARVIGLSRNVTDDVVYRFARFIRVQDRYNFPVIMLYEPDISCASAPSSFIPCDPMNLCPINYLHTAIITNTLEQEHIVDSCGRKYYFDSVLNKIYMENNCRFINLDTGLQYVYEPTYSPVGEEEITDNLLPLVETTTSDIFDKGDVDGISMGFNNLYPECAQEYADLFCDLTIENIFNLDIAQQFRTICSKSDLVKILLDYVVVNSDANCIQINKDITDAMGKDNVDTTDVIIQDLKIDILDQIDRKKDVFNLKIEQLEIFLRTPDDVGRIEEIINGSSFSKFAWIRRLGHFIIDYVEMEIEGQIIDRHYGMWMNIWYELTKKVGLVKGYDQMIGDISYLYEYNNIRKDGYIMYVPLYFWFCKSSGLFIPLIALQYNNVRLHVKFRSFDDIAYYEDGAEFVKLIDRKKADTKEQIIVGIKPELKCQVLAQYIYVEQRERQRIAKNRHEYLIDQTQFNGLIAVSSQNNETELHFTSPCKEFVWMQQLDEFVDGSLQNKEKQWYNYSTEPYVYSSAKYKDKIKNVINEDSKELLVNGQVLYKYTEPLVNGKYYQQPTSLINKSVIKLNGKPRVQLDLGPLYYSTRQSYDHHSHTGLSGINLYSYSFYPELVDQPSGALNMTKIDESSIATCSNTDGPAKLYVYAPNYNILRVLSGMSGLAFNF